MINTMNPEVDIYLNKVPNWQEELEKLRLIILDCHLTEELKWGVPIYTFQKNNILGINGFKDYCAVGFFKGSLLSDTYRVLFKAGKNSQAGSTMRFSSVTEIAEMEQVLKAYIFEAIEIEKSGLKIDYKKPEDLLIPDEFKLKLDEMSSLKAAFQALTPGRQKAYIFYFSEPKQPKTRELRIEKYIPRIMSGKGLNDCICGLSHKQPTCDGSHKYIQQEKHNP